MYEYDNTWPNRLSDLATATQKTDPWAHRSEGMKCKTCMWYVPKAGATQIGRCRRHAPTMGGFPAVYPADWCGDHRVDENASA
jgi:hypothetical protein